METGAKLRAWAVLAALLLPAFREGQAISDKHPWEKRTGQAADRMVPGWFVNLGPTGLRAVLHPLEFEVKYVFPDSPAFGKLEVGDRIVGAGGRRFTTPHTFGWAPDKARTGGTGPLKDLGLAIEDAEGKDGTLKLSVERNGKARDVLVPIRKLGRFSKTWPYDCPKSDLIFREICEFLASSGDESALTGLVLLSSPDPRHAVVVKRIADRIGQRVDPFERKSLNNWTLVYDAFFLSEYFLATRDEKVPAVLRRIDEGLVFAQNDDGSFQHQKDWGGYKELGIMTGLAVTAWGLMGQAGVAPSHPAFDKAFARLKYTTAPDGNVNYSGKGRDMDADLGRTGAGVMGHLMAAGDPESPGYADRGLQYLEQHWYYFPDCHGSPGVGMQWAALAASRSPRALRKLLDEHLWYWNLSRCPEPGQFVAQPNRSGDSGCDYLNLPRSFQAGTIGLILSLKEKRLRLTGARPPAGARRQKLFLGPRDE